MKPQIQTKIYKVMMKTKWILHRVARTPKIKDRSIHQLHLKGTPTMSRALILYQIARTLGFSINLLKKICKGNIVVIIGRKSNEGNK